MSDIPQNEQNSSTNAAQPSLADSVQQNILLQNKTLQSLLEQSIAVQAEANKLKKSTNRLTWLKYLGVGFVSLFTIMGIMRATAPANNLKMSPAANYVNIVEIEGVIGAGADVSADRLVPVLEKAYSDPTAKGVILKINSPGGSPVQSSIIHDRIVSLKNKYQKKTVVVGEDIVASGGYFIAVAADEIVVNRSTLIGSIGVIHSSFGFSGLLDKIGVDRRVLTAGESKNKMDPFLPLKPSDTAFLQDVLGKTHEHFKDVVKAGRKEKLDLTNTHLFDGSVWTGADSVKIGIADKQGDLWTVLQEEFNSAKPVLVRGPENLFQDLFKQMGVSVGETIVNKITASEQNLSVK